MKIISNKRYNKIQEEIKRLNTTLQWEVNLRNKVGKECDVLKSRNTDLQQLNETNVKFAKDMLKEYKKELKIMKAKLTKATNKLGKEMCEKEKLIIELVGSQIAEGLKEGFEKDPNAKEVTIPKTTYIRDAKGATKVTIKDYCEQKRKVGRPRKKDK